MTGQNNAERDLRLSRIQELLYRSPSKDFAKTYAEAEQLLDLVKIHCGEGLAPSLNDHFHSMPHRTYEEKKSICRWANEAVRRIGLAVKCPSTGLPAFLFADPVPAPKGRFRLKAGLEHNTSRITVAHVELWPIELMPAAPRKEGWAVYNQTRANELRDR